MKSNMPLIHNRRHAMQAAATAALASRLSRPLTVLGQEAPSLNQESDPTSGIQKLPFVDRIGLQLYTVRNEMKQDAEATLKAIALAGYRQVELMSIDEDAVEVAAIARDHGMMVHSAFIDWKCIATPEAEGVASVDVALEYAERIGLRHVVFGYINRDSRDTGDKCKAVADRANLAARKTRESGMRMSYHNHSFEFAPLNGTDSNAFELFIERFDERYLSFELDVFWTKLGGLDPIETMNRLAGRISMVHLKDLKQGVGVIYDEGKVPVDAFQECGDGTIDMPQVMKLAAKIGVVECHVEQDQSPAPLASVGQSFRYLNQS